MSVNGWLVVEELMVDGMNVYMVEWMGKYVMMHKYEGTVDRWMERQMKNLVYGKFG